MASEPYDLAIAGGGPAGAACAILCARAGLRTLVLEKSRFPRDKVCGDCLNPRCWPLLEELGVAREVLASTHSRVERVAFVHGRREAAFRLNAGEPGEIAIARRILDSILLRQAISAGAEIIEESPIRSVARDHAALWRLETGSGMFTARLLVAADGRNSTVARLLGAAPAARRDRVGMQIHAPSPAPCPGIELHLFPSGYCGVAPVGGGLTNFCMVGAPGRLEALKAAVINRFAIPPELEWRAIAPLERAPIGPLLDGVVYIGDAARVVEPFTGEGIYYALHSGVLAARHIAADSLDQFPVAHAALYRRRLWINRVARWAVTHPRTGALLIETLKYYPPALKFLIERVTAKAPIAAAVRPSPAHTNSQAHPASTSVV